MTSTQEQMILRDFTDSPSIRTPLQACSIPASSQTDNPEDASNNLTSSGETSTQKANEGLEYWNRQRALWTGGNFNTPVISENQNNPALAKITPNKYPSIYNTLVYEEKKLAKPLPLPYVIKILVSGWKKDGTWPTETSQPMVPNCRTQTPVANAVQSAQTSRLTKTNSEVVNAKKI